MRKNGIVVPCGQSIAPLVITRHTILCLLVLVSGVVAGQEKKEKVPGAQKFVLGLQAGYNTAFTRYRDADYRQLYSTKPGIGFSVGGSINFPMKQDFSFQAEAGYTQAARNVDSNGDTWRNHATYRFVDIHWLLRKSLKINIKRDVLTEFYINGGPNIKYWLGGNGSIEALGPSQSYSIVFNKTPGSEYDKMYMNNANRLLFGFDVGVGFDAGTLVGQKVNIELRYTQGQTYFGGKNSAAINLLGFQDNMLTSMRLIQLSAAYTWEFDSGKRHMGKSTSRLKKKRR